MVYYRNPKTKHVRYQFTTKLNASGPALYKCCHGWPIPPVQTCMGLEQIWNYTKSRRQTDNIMSFVKEYTNLFPEGIWNCLFPEGPKALKEISCYRFLKEINCIFLIKTHDIRFIIYAFMKKNIEIISLSMEKWWKYKGISQINPM